MITSASWFYSRKSKSTLTNDHLKKNPLTLRSNNVKFNQKSFEQPLLPQFILFREIFAILYTVQCTVIKN